MILIGIDLGTTNSLGCVYRDGLPELIPNKYGSYLTPSVVAIDDQGKVIVGQMAKEMKILYPERTASSFKKDMGTDKVYHLGKYTFTPEELSSYVIASILEDAKNYLMDEIEEAVISVPAYFYDKQRTATKRAGVLAGVKVNRIINEPSAAALASYMDYKKESNFLVIDFGGGTLDVSVVNCIGRVVEIESVSGDNHLGGDDFDEAIAESFIEEHCLKNLDKKDYAILLRKAERTKRELSEEVSADLKMTINNQEYISTYDMKRLMVISKSIIGGFRDVVSRALKDSRVKASQISEIILAGGTSKMPIVQSYVRHLFHRHPLIRSDCDDLIALGLGYFCGIKDRKEGIKDYILTDICPFSLGVNVKNPSDPTNPFMSMIINRNSVLPCTKMQIYETSYDNQEIISVKVLQGESLYANENKLLGEMKISVAPKPKGEESITIRYSYDINGILIVEVTVLSTGTVYKKVISEDISEEELQQRIAQLEAMKADPAELTENKLLLERLKALYEEVAPYNKDTVKMFMEWFMNALDSGSYAKIESYRLQIKELIERLAVDDPFAVEEDLVDEDDWDDFLWNVGSTDEGPVS